jgi:integrase
VQLLHSILNRAVRHAQARDKVKRNVVLLCETPTGQTGRPSKSLTLEQAEAVLRASENSNWHAYIVLSLLLGARTEELRALTWDSVDLDGDANAQSPVTRSINVWRSVRAGGDTKTRKSRRTLAMPMRCVVALRLHRIRQTIAYRKAGYEWNPSGLVFASKVGTPLDSHNVRRGFRQVVKAAGLEAYKWTPRELRHSFVSLLSDSGMPLEDIARLCGHSGTAVTETIYRHQIKPIIDQDTVAMDRIFSFRSRSICAGTAEPAKSAVGNRVRAAWPVRSRRPRSPRCSAPPTAPVRRAGARRTPRGRRRLRRRCRCCCPTAVRRPH